MYRITDDNICGKIIVVTHKDYPMPQDDIYLPIGVGGGIAGEKFQPDDTGDNISSLNGTYCELTGIYWAWKYLDLKSLAYIGTAHYRRHFSLHKHVHTLDKAVNKKEVQDIFGDKLNNIVITIPKTFYPLSVEKHYIHSLKGAEEVHKKDIMRLREAIHALFPEYDDAVSKILGSHGVHLKNMFIMATDNFDRYCNWLFSVMNRVVELSVDRPSQRRYAGALSEFCLDIWLQRNSFFIKELKLLETEKIPLGRRIKRVIKNW